MSMLKSGNHKTCLLLAIFAYYLDSLLEAQCKLPLHPIMRQSDIGGGGNNNADSCFELWFSSSS